ARRTTCSSARSTSPMPATAIPTPASTCYCCATSTTSRLKLACERAQLDLRFDDRGHQLDPRCRRLDLRAAGVEQLEQRAAAQAIGAFRHLEEALALVEHFLFEACERRPARGEGLQVAAELGLLRRRHRALPFARRKRFRARLVDERAAVIQDRDLGGQA